MEFFGCCGNKEEAKVSEAIVASQPAVQEKEEAPPAEPPAEPPAPPPAPPAEKVAEEEPSAPYMFTRIFTKAAGSKLGMSVDTKDGIDVVSKIEPDGVIAQRFEKESENIQIFDRVLQVNGVADVGKERLLQTLPAEKVEFVLERPKIQELQVSKKGRKLGLTLENIDLVHGILIKGMGTEGALVEDYPAGTVQAMDRLVKIDGKECSGAEMMKKLQESEDFSITVVSYSK
eukprot:TRINITY_DN51964_c0_g1_i1.p1 TRINITY_DN51964_c0_g1~~TRINITY_DN51964_c0_g1_i1.p1  ORF type:complete len:231 (-),score=65.84 TRINITY_DN51964_c0_g1_i1:97-789(-)